MVLRGKAPALKKNQNLHREIWGAKCRFWKIETNVWGFEKWNAGFEKIGTTVCGFESWSARFEKIKTDIIVQVSGVQKLMVKRMVEANAVQQSGYGDEICMDGLMEVRSALKPIGTY